MHTTWIESPIQGRHGGPIRAGQWSFVVIGTHPVQVGQTVDLELVVNEQPYGTLPAYWLENKSGNSYWHVPVPPIGINSRIRYMAVTRDENREIISQTHMLHAIVRPNPPRNMEFTQVVQQV
ncbi:MAG: glycosyl hydrolase, partial [Isosphaeraceae bacterium]